MFVHYIASFRKGIDVFLGEDFRPLNRISLCIEMNFLEGHGRFMSIDNT